jgi:hypothetical protein
LYLALLDENFDIAIIVSRNDDISGERDATRPLQGGGKISAALLLR